jgi:hypothetical protein
MLEKTEGAIQKIDNKKAQTTPDKTHRTTTNKTQNRKLKRSEK